MRRNGLYDLSAYITGQQQSLLHAGDVLKMDLRGLRCRLFGSPGLRLSLDDFCTGYSSLQYVKRLPLEQLKIDKSFIQGIETKSDDRAIVTTIIAMAKNLNVEVIAEAVATEAQRQFLAEHGSNLFQVYIFGRPQPMEEFLTSLEPA